MLISSIKFNIFEEPGDSNDAHDKLKILKSGDKVEITKLSHKDGKKEIIKYDINLLSKNEGLKDKINDNFYDTMLKSYNDALKIQENLNGIVDVNRIAITYL